MIELIGQHKFALLVWYIIPTLICLGVTYTLNFGWEFKLCSLMGFYGAFVFLCYYSFHWDIDQPLLYLLLIFGGVFFIPAWRRVVKEAVFFERGPSIMNNYILPIFALFVWFFICPILIGVLVWEGRNLRKIVGKKLAVRKPTGELAKWKDVREEKEEED